MVCLTVPGGALVLLIVKKLAAGGGDIEGDMKKNHVVPLYSA